jgi:hypothetical protein
MWLLDPLWSHGAMATLSLDPLEERAAVEMLTAGGMPAAAARRIARQTTGHPLAIALALRAFQDRPALSLDETVAYVAVEHLARLHVEEVPDDQTREALLAGSLVRRVTLALLRALLPGCAPQDLYDRLHALPFIDAGRDGLVIHEAVRSSIAATLRSMDPGRHWACLHAACRCLQRDAARAGIQELWRYTADMLFLLQNPVLREAFFPSGGQSLIVEPAVPGDEAAISAITGPHEGPEGARALAGWWQHLPGAFNVVRDHDGDIVGYYALRALPTFPHRLRPPTRSCARGMRSVRGWQAPGLALCSTYAAG